MRLRLPLLALLSLSPLALVAEEAAPAKADAKPAAAAAAEPAGVPGMLALQRLMEGNARYVSGKAAHPHQDAARRAEVANGQHPFAIILSCADSRVAPEILFDEGLGDLFVVRIAGNVCDDDVQASIEYAVEHLGCNLVVVLGHERCGAVKAALAGGELPGHLPGLIDRIKPAVESSKGQPGEALHNAVCANARLVANQLRTGRSPLRAAVDRGDLAILSARADLDTGLVELLW